MLAGWMNGQLEGYKIERLYIQKRQTSYIEIATINNIGTV